jgi:phosphatidate cytidylyltransferase
MKVRIIAAVALLPLLLVVLIALPAVFTAILVGLLCAVAAYELLMKTGLVKEKRLVAYTAVMAFLVSVWSYFSASYAAALLGVIGFTTLLFAELMFSHTKPTFENIAVCFAAGLLVPFLLSALVRLRSGYNGAFYVLIPFLLAFTSDSGAYFAGSFLGKHKLAPLISPKKTIEGVIGGVVAAMVGMLLYCCILDVGFGFNVRYLNALAYGVIGALVGVFGDLCFSAIKRQVGIKDYGNLIPGHGGVLDRFDSMTLIAPITEALLILLPVAVR